MKKITSRETFEFNAGNEEILAISPEGCLASDQAAAIAVARFGGLVQVSEADVQAEVNKLTGDADAEVSDSLKRPELEEIAKARGLSDEDIAAAKTKTDLAALINATPAKEDANS
jgi:hypothetical protein